MEMICFLEISLGLFPGDAAHQTWKKGDHGKLQIAIFETEIWPSTVRLACCSPTATQL